MRTIFALLLTLLIPIATAAQSDAATGMPWLDIVLDRGLAYALVIGGAWFLAQKAYPDGKRFADSLVESLQNIERKIDALADALGAKRDA